MIDWKAYKNLPSKLIGKTEKEAADLITTSGGPFLVAQRDGEHLNVVLPVAIWLNVNNGIIVGAQLDGVEFGKW